MRLASINIEGSNHLGRVVPFLKKFEPEVVFLQEAFEKDLPHFSKVLDLPSYRFTVMCKREEIEGSGSEYLPWGLAILSRFPILSTSETYYVGDRSRVPNFDRLNIYDVNKAVLQVVVVKDGELFNLCNTHLTWTPDGKPTPLQLGDFSILLKILKTYGDIVLCGDFNAPREGAVWGEIARLYKDNIPLEVKTTVDTRFHKNKTLVLVVDGLFTSRSYDVRNVRVTDGLSDHCAITGLICKFLVQMLGG